MTGRIIESITGKREKSLEEHMTMDEFREIVRRLRAEDGCPWDRKQTHQSLRSCMMEEASEFVASVKLYEETGHDENMIEELGDMLLQVVMNAQIASEEGRFTLDDVIDGIGEKLIRRHPHVFGNKEAGTPEEALANWKEEKSREKESRDWKELSKEDTMKEGLKYLKLAYEKK